MAEYVSNQPDRNRPPDAPIARHQNSWSTPRVDALTEFAQFPVAWLPPLLAAPFIGSFAGVLIERLPTDRPVALARSQCDHCRPQRRSI